MKVVDIFEREDDTDCVRGIVMDTFDERYIELAAVMGMDLEDIKYNMPDQDNRELAQEVMILDNMISLQANSDLHISRNEEISAKLDGLEQALDNAEGDTNLAAVKEMIGFLNSYVTTFEKWSETQEGQEAVADAMEQCQDRANPHAARGVSPSDF